MTQAPQGLDAEEVERLFQQVRLESSLASRVDQFSASFLGRPYLDNPLEGGPELKEKFKISLLGFDCVTYIETVIALARTTSLREFVNEMREMRYAGGVIDWYHRNHYMVDWAKNNQKRAVIENLTRGPRTIIKTRRLSVIEALPAKTTSFRCFPKHSLAKARSLMKTGDVILFASTKKSLDVFHTGFLIEAPDGILLRHATRAAGSVIEQSLASFLTMHRMSGFILLRPLCQK